MNNFDSYNKKRALAPHLKVLYNTSFYRSWYNMKTRCNNPNCTDYFRWGGRGITYDSKWETFRGFYDDMFIGYKQGLSLDRIDNNKGYSKSNCRWATAKEQANNRKNSRLFTINGVTLTLSQWIDRVGIKHTTAKTRFYNYRWPIEEALGIVERPNYRKRNVQF